MKINQTSAKTVRLEATKTRAKLVAAERQGRETKVAMRAAKATYKEAKRALKVARKKAKATRESIIQLREAATAADRKWRKIEKKLVRARRTATSKAKVRTERSTRPIVVKAKMAPVTGPVPFPSALAPARVPRSRSVMSPPPDAPKLLNEDANSRDAL